MAKIYKTTPEIRFNIGLVVVNIDGLIKVADVFTKPNGSASNYLSVGKVLQITDKFGDISQQWEHHEYPNNFKYDGFACKREYDGSGAQMSIQWTFLVPQQFVDDGFCIARVGSGRGGKGWRDNDILVFLNKERIEHPTTLRM